jgi:hypothetical protein
LQTQFSKPLFSVPSPTSLLHPSNKLHLEARNASPEISNNARGRYKKNKGRELLDFAGEAARLPVPDRCIAHGGGGNISSCGCFMLESTLRTVCDI